MSSQVRSAGHTAADEVPLDRTSGGRQFFKIGEVSRTTGLETYVLRYWESEFPGLRPRKTAGGQRVYTKKDVDLIFRIKSMLYDQGFTIAGARKRLRQRTGHDRTEPKLLLGEIRGELLSILDELRGSAPLRPSVRPGASRPERGRP